MSQPNVYDRTAEAGYCSESACVVGAKVLIVGIESKGTMMMTAGGIGTVGRDESVHRGYTRKNIVPDSRLQQSSMQF